MAENPILLIAEDDDSSFMLLQMLLRMSYRFDRAMNGAEAVRMVKEKHYDAVLMDLRMPELDGLDAMRQIKSFNPNIPIIVQTANAFESDRQSSIEAGCDGFITKPIVASQLKETLKKALGGGKKRHK